MSAYLAVAGVLITAGCGSTNDASGDGSDRPTVVVTTNILGDVVRQSVGDLIDLEVIMPLGSDPHDFAPSARQAEAMEQADLLVVNGAGFEEGMTDIILNAEDSGTPVFTAADHVSLLTLDDDHDEEDAGHADEEPEEQADADHDDDGSDHGSGVDPHLWTDPDRVGDVVAAFGSVLGEIETIDGEQLTASVDAYVDDLADLATAMETTLADVAPEQRVLVTNHEVFGYFADRFDFEVVGTVIPSLSTGAEPSAAALERLAVLIETEGVRAVFAETTSSSRLAEVLAGEVDGALAGDVAVIELFSESLGDPGSGAETYVDMMSTNAALIADALGG
ncbi:MAG: metal ABC transporter substrate-binding protein [Ilumatobacter sp.]|uniref:metal ABC transporter solute-binding protein, Zn/Mn family n=1 Tax=Ilumatobacter sp. TaxID=1967498 RepID=UPI003C721F24